MSAADRLQYPQGMSSELDVLVRGAPPDLLADRAQRQLRSILDVMGLLKDTTVQWDRPPRDWSACGFGELGLGIVYARPRRQRGASDTTLEDLDGGWPCTMQCLAQAEVSADLAARRCEELAVVGGRFADGPLATADGE